MKRYLCTVAAGLALALMSTATASADIGLPLPGQSGSQETNLGDQTVGEQKNDADVTQEQGNGNIAVSPAVGILGSAETTNAQGNGNVAKSNVDQENEVEQSQDSHQEQSLAQSGTDACCDGQSQAGEQKTYGGDQTVEKQKNDADVTQEQGNGNVAISPAIAVFGNAETTNAQGNRNVAKSDVDQDNEVEQSQESTQKQDSTQSGGSNGWTKSKCCDGQSQTGEQKTSFGDQTVGKQKNDADVTQKQGNGNVAVSPAIAIFGDAKTTNHQGNGNYAESDIDQKNEVEQEQDSYQRQSLGQSGSGGHCCGGSSQTGEQKTYGGDQTVEKQKNDADVTQKQGNGNVAISPAIAIFGNAETRNYQGNGNVAKSDVDQENEVEQKQVSTQKQELTQDGGRCCGGSSQTGEQKTSFGDQYVGEQKNDADVTQKQGNGNFALSPAVGIGGGLHEPCNSTCGKSRLPLGGDAKTSNYQGNGNVAKSDVDQENEVEQKQVSTQKQELTQDGGSCCTPAYDRCKTSYECQPKKEYDPKPAPSCSARCEPQKGYGKKSYAKDQCCERGRNQTGEQKAFFGDQTVGKQENDADVTQKQGNHNGAVSPAVGFGGGLRGDSCGSKCGNSRYPSSHGAVTQNEQGNGNYADSDIDQENEVEQRQTSYQRQDLVEMCKGLINR